MPSHLRRRSKPADFTERVTFSTNTPSTDTQGGRSSSWSDTFTAVHCELAPLSGAEIQRAQALDSSVQFKLRMYQRADITSGMRVAWTASWNGSLVYSFEVLSVLPDPNRSRVFQLLTLGDID